LISTKVLIEISQNGNDGKGKKLQLESRNMKMPISIFKKF
jgi:hypothetical protein